jgi:hypothetical protein
MNTIHLQDATDDDRAVCGAWADSEIVTPTVDRVNCATCLFTVYPELYYDTE